MITGDKSRAIIWWDSLTPEQQTEVEKKHGFYGHDIGTDSQDVEKIWNMEDCPDPSSAKRIQAWEAHMQKSLDWWASMDSVEQDLMEDKYGRFEYPETRDHDIFAVWSLEGFPKPIEKKEYQAPPLFGIKLLIDFFLWFRDNGDKHIGLSVEELVDVYLSVMPYKP